MKNKTKVHIGQKSNKMRESCDINSKRVPTVTLIYSLHNNLSTGGIKICITVVCEVSLIYLFIYLA